MLKLLSSVCPDFFSFFQVFNIYEFWNAYVYKTYLLIGLLRFLEERSFTGLIKLKSFFYLLRKKKSFITFHGSI